jgi:uncharacterized Rossmann fold enzyme
LSEISFEGKTDGKRFSILGRNFGNERLVTAGLNPQGVIEFTDWNYPPSREATGQVSSFLKAGKLSMLEEYMCVGNSYS